MADPETRGQRLRARRVELDLTLAEVAERSGLSLPYVSNLERGRGNPTEEALRALAEALELPLAAVIGEDGDLDSIEVVLADAPRSLLAFAKTSRFRDAVARLAEQQHADSEEMRRRMLVGMASAPRRSTGDPTEEDWRRLLDVYSLILQE
jgi:transcriptional regulator with XRE-family HTH domain